MAPAAPMPSTASVTFRGDFQSFTPPIAIPGVSIELTSNADGSTTATLDLSAHAAITCPNCRTPSKAFVTRIIDQQFERIQELMKNAHRRSAEYLRLHVKNYSRRVEGAVRRNSLTESDVDSDPDLDVTKTPFREALRKEYVSEQNQRHEQVRGHSKGDDEIEVWRKQGTACGEGLRRAAAA
ncbi:hypothetical protein EXIGLDRAFT_706883 [Exidia glandulosa HHB12029]|uniref:Uncharacterized protein n=1 Tax=Exidia glandulosa HHB12029 TaxID=1314781 RepID=A0A165K1U1_EXIGL|nr:hypothetical protein EXIGLDRAFT_706883 [Exidia glandulosa HHB12029]